MITFWVRSDEEDPDNFVYRAAEEDGSQPTCYDPVARTIARADWEISGSVDLSLKECDDLDGPAAEGTLYTVQRKS